MKQTIFPDKMAILLTRFARTFKHGARKLTFETFGYDRFNFVCFPETFSRHFSKETKCPVKLGYQVCEPNSGSKDHLPPLVFLHAFGLSKEDWGYIPKTIADLTQREVYCLDTRNHGDSERSDDYDCDLNVKDFLHFIDEKKIIKAVVIGHCIGGVTAIKAALQAPEKIAMIFVEDVFVHGYPPVVGKIGRKLIKTLKELQNLISPEMKQHELDKLIAAYIILNRKDHAKNRFNPYDGSYPLKKNSSGRYEFKLNLNALEKKLININLWIGKVEGKYYGPSYFLNATDSFMEMNKQTDHILKYFPNAVMETFEGNSHYIHREVPDKFLETIVKHIKLNDKNQL